ncbi:hypothetical protein VTI28DRAFT_4698 [Corynascus sepedonium]
MPIVLFLFPFTLWRLTVIVIYHHYYCYCYCYYYYTTTNYYHYYSNRTESASFAPPLILFLNIYTGSSTRSGGLELSLSIFASIRGLLLVLGNDGDELVIVDNDRYPLVYFFILTWFDLVVSLTEIFLIGQRTVASCIYSTKTICQTRHAMRVLYHDFCSAAQTGTWRQLVMIIRDQVCEECRRHHT